MIQYRKTNVKEDEIKAVEETERQQVLLYNCIVLCIYVFGDHFRQFSSKLSFEKELLGAGFLILNRARPDVYLYVSISAHFVRITWCENILVLKEHNAETDARWDLWLVNFNCGSTTRMSSVHP